MLLIDLLSLGLKVDVGQIADDGHILDALTKKYGDFPPLEATNDLYSLELESTEQLNRKLYALVNLKMNLTLTQVMQVISYPNFTHFDDASWALLHLVCVRCDAASKVSIMKWVYQWIFNPPVKDIKRQNDLLVAKMQARLFLLSQLDFSLQKADSRHMIESILESDNVLAWLALISHPEFDMAKFSDKLDPIRTGITKAVKIIWDFVRFTGLVTLRREVLLNNIVALNVQQTLLACDNDSLTALIKSSSSIQNLKPEAVEFLALIGNQLISRWTLVLNSEQENKITKRKTELLDTGKEMSAAGENGMRKDFMQENARAIEQQFLALAAVPGLLDKQLENGGRAILTEKMNAALNCYPTSFFRDFSYALWGAKLNTPRICDDTSVDWLMSLEAFKNLSFLSIDAQTVTGIMMAIFQAGDQYFIQKLFTLNEECAGRPLIAQFAPMTRLAQYTPEQSVSITNLLQYSTFYVSNYYAEASDAFKALPQVNTAYQLSRLFVCTAPEEMKKIKAEAARNFDITTFVNELTQRYGKNLQQLVTQAVQEMGSARPAYKAIKRIFELVKLVRNQSPAYYKQLSSNHVFIQFNLNYRIERYRSEKENTKDWIKQNVTGMFKDSDATRLKDLKIQFLDYILRHITMNEKEKAAAERMQKAAGRTFIQMAYDLYSLNKDGKRIAGDVQTWLKDFILHGKKTAQTLYSLPPEMLEKIFSGVDLNEPGENYTNAQVIEKMAFGKVFASDTERNAALDELERDSDSGSTLNADDVRAASASVASQSSAEARLLTQGYATTNTNIKGDDASKKAWGLSGWKK